MWTTVQGVSFFPCKAEGYPNPQGGGGAQRGSRLGADLCLQPLTVPRVAAPRPNSRPPPPRTAPSGDARGRGGWGLPSAGLNLTAPPGTEETAFVLSTAPPSGRHEGQRRGKAWEDVPLPSPSVGTEERGGGERVVLGHRREWVFCPMIPGAARCHSSIQRFAADGSPANGSPMAVLVQPGPNPLAGTCVCVWVMCVVPTNPILFGWRILSDFLFAFG